MMGYRRLFIIRKDLHLSAGKLAAMVSHCAEAYWTNMIRKWAFPFTTNWAYFDHDEIKGYNCSFTINKDIYEKYICDSFVKTICEARNKNHLLKAAQLAKDTGLKENVDFGLIYDKCLTELEPEEEDGTTLVGIWFCPLPDEKAHEISKKYQLYRG